MSTPPDSLPVRVPVSDEFDFSSYRPGDVICISMHEIRTRGQAQSLLIIAAIANAASRAGLEWVTVRDDPADELRISFSAAMPGANGILRADDGRG